MSHACSRGLGDPGRFPHFAAARQYLIGALQLDLAAAALRARCADPLVDAVLASTHQQVVSQQQPQPDLAAASHFRQQLPSIAQPLQQFPAMGMLQDSTGEISFAV